MLYTIKTKYTALEEWGITYYKHYSTSLTPYKAGFVSGYEHCCAFVTNPEFRKALNQALIVVTLATFLGAHLIGPMLVPTISLSLSKIYLLSHGLDYVSAYIAKRAEGIREPDPDRAKSYDLYSGFIKSVSDTILISGMATTLAAAIVGALSQVQFKLPYNILVPTADAIIRTIGFELSKGKDATLKRETSGEEAQQYLLKTVLTGASYKILTSMLGSSLVADLFAFVASRSFSAAFIAAKKDTSQLPERMWENLNSSISFCAQYFLLGISGALLKSVCESSTGLSGIALRSVTLELAKEPVTQIKNLFKGVHEKAEIYYKDIKVPQMIKQLYNHASMLTEQQLEKLHNTLPTRPSL